ncbi:MAG: DUF5663 domain-containing protein [Candidatus Saccharibacteria bacterium]|nr:DUF5663 domain-containing protein [Candidatus Saccharibacteria bacterium]
MELNNKFLEEVGLSSLPEEEKQAFLEYLYSEIELRVGDTLSRDMTPEQVVEFKKIADKDSSFIVNWLSAFVPMYHSDEVFKNMQKITGYDVTDSRLLSEYAASKWLELNRPDYGQVVANVISQIRQEIIKNKDKMLK